ncbi:MAG: flavodoxin-dependent (E)-4-hydroxy-3-methylbut-2-enyl-diphosphate synthase [Peptoniphilus harei]|uniref:4-hydroxy-3-methylbut-2-en-1-yl diphosphate synthase (flavodoxin) n=1 Tax=Peptoniphilus harei ACS-146-V-Sch2b TaxID=908338 RepID=E4KYH9_9FIRM|nr:flavodoxin-dependent (E)-4-hydroxy-3-methylbut-2-enyl-diphosphate synthase [Peptoniphilus harei]EFR33128.1 4-hydroxy-3-methylbut-2-en-1-yl diphosphate synthase [Peptoniphilus harei ACS-146-V-Sch2b]MDK7755178.1 flavodoxin-dependent (E)-4-hydroxy-3-methylbut-2-enyl-diphosphate synthase [Peptoniphilus harei]MDK7760985.1 flavodoxin-dependent (E)-4-hydroxy-3-methylbut-2-enyl-diphosphate synthase [Peptoniphilus harei]MDK8270775.1 flavodoxin-dependent (E)-4-hydroxy-3-methylbut-2-enyl-diphosphate sy
MINRKETKKVYVGNVPIGGNSFISIQSMTNTNTKDVKSTVSQIKKLENAGCDIIRMAVNDLEDAAALREIKKEINIPIISDIQFNYKLALAACENESDAIRLNPGNIGASWKVKEVVEACKFHNIPIRVGVNSGSVKQEFLDKFNGVNASSICYSALEEIELLEKNNFYDIAVSLKASSVNLTIESYRKFSEMSNYPLHLGVTEAGSPKKGIVKSAIGIGTLLAEGIGDTIRVSLTSDPLDEVIAGKDILKALDLKREGIDLISCPTCARTKVDLIEIVNKAEEKLYSLDKNLKVAIMGCPVNGPGEAREADIGIACGHGEGLIFSKGEILKKVPEDMLLSELLSEIEKIG